MPNTDEPSVTLYLNRSTGRYHANVWWGHGDRQRPSLRTGDAAEAEIRFEAFKRDLLPGIVAQHALDSRAPVAEAAPTKTDPSIGELVRWYCDIHLKDLRREESTIHKYSSILGNFEVFCRSRNIGRVSQVSYDRIGEFLDWLSVFGREKLHRDQAEAKSLSPKYRDNCKTILRAWLYAAKEAEKLADIPVKKWFISNSRKRVTDTFAMNAKELRECLSIVQREAPHLNNIVLFMAHTGCRVSDARDLRWSQVNKEGRYARRHQIKTKNLATYSLNDTSLAAVLAEEARKTEKAGHVFTNDLHQAFSYNSIYRGFTRALERADFTVTRDGEDRRVDLKCLRHTYGTIMAHLGCPPFLLQRQMGHQKIETTLQYYHVDPSEGLKWAERFEEVTKEPAPTSP